MRRAVFSAFLALAAPAAWLAGAASADGDKGTMGLSVYPPADVRWGNGPASLPAGAKLAVLEGDPRKEGSFVMRLKLPDGYRIPPHTHAKPERVTVISGTFNIGTGDRFDAAKGTAMPRQSTAICQCVNVISAPVASQPMTMPHRPPKALKRHASAMNIPAMCGISERAAQNFVDRPNLRALDTSSASDPTIGPRLAAGIAKIWRGARKTRCPSTLKPGVISVSLP